VITPLLHMVWLGSPIPNKVAGNMAEWQLQNPEWNLNIWTAPLPSMLNLDLFERAHEFVKPDAVWQFRADLMRYEILYQYGGLYVDCDTTPLRPLGDLLDDVQEFAVREDKDWIGNTYLASEPATELFAALTERQREHTKQFSGHAAAGVVSGPQYLTPIWQEFGGHVDERTELWLPYSWSHVRKRNENSVKIPDGAYAIHAWEHSRERRKRTDAEYRRERNRL
jgi:mannosyltransferase OCH1-like enzyme